MMPGSPSISAAIGKRVGRLAKLRHGRLICSPRRVKSLERGKIGNGLAIDLKAIEDNVGDGAFAQGQEHGQRGRGTEGLDLLAPAWPQRICDGMRLIDRGTEELPSHAVAPIDDGHDVARANGRPNAFKAEGGLIHRPALDVGLGRGERGDRSSAVVAILTAMPMANVMRMGVTTGSTPTVEWPALHRQAARRYVSTS